MWARSRSSFHVPSTRGTFCADVPVDAAGVMAADPGADRPGRADRAGHRRRVERHTVVVPGLRGGSRDRGGRAGLHGQADGRTTLTLTGSHTAFIAQPVTVAQFVAQALTA